MPVLGAHLAVFLSTPPSRVATTRLEPFKGRFSVSIHATLAGGDECLTTCRNSFIMFLSTPPSRVATCCWRCRIFYRGRFYPRHPRGWRRCDPLVVSVPVAGFYPRHPRGWRLQTVYDVLAGRYVSIHATLAGGDCRSLQFPARSCWFLSTPPSRVATAAPTGEAPLSTSFYPRHPRGWRRCDCFTIYWFPQFLSTPPSRVATRSSCPRPRTGTRFYPRHPRGWRLPNVRYAIEKPLFLSTPPSRVATLLEASGARMVRRFYPRHPRGWRL